MICNFNNQSHERRLIFIMITPPLYLAWERELEFLDTKRSSWNKGAASSKSKGDVTGFDWCNS